MKRILALLLTLALMAALFTGCTKDKTASNEKTQPGGASGQSETESKTAYQANFLKLPEVLDTVQSSVFTDGALFLAAMDPSEETSQEVDEATGAVYGYRSYVSTLYREDLKTGAIETLPVPVEGCGQPQVNALSKAADGSLWAVCQTFEQQPQDGEYIWSFVHYASDGSVLETVRADFTGSGLNVSDVYLQYLAADDAGHLICADYSGTIYIFDEAGRLLKTLSQDGTYGDLATLDKGLTGILYYDDSGKQVFTEIDPETLDWGETISLGVGAWNVFADPADGRLFYFSNGAIYRYDLQTQEKAKIVTLLDCDLDASELVNICPSESGDMQVLLCTQNGGVDRSYSLCTLHAVDASTLPEKTVLTLATLSLSQSLRQQIAKFNRENDACRIEVQDYSQYSEVVASPGSYTKDASSAITKLNTELLAGNLPDLIDFTATELPTAQYAAKGFLEDLLPYLQADGTLSEDKLNGNVLRALKTDGKLYQMPTAFSVIGAAGKHEIVGGYDAWTLDAMHDAMQKLPADATVFNVDYTKDSAVFSCLASSFSQFVNWETGTCSFDTDAFKTFLRFADSFPAEFDATNFDFDDYSSDYRRVGQKQQLLANIAFSGFDDIYYQLEAMENDADFVGYPGYTGGFGCGFLPQGSIAMTTACKDKDAAWGFLRTLLSEDAQLAQSAFPMLNTAFDKKAAEAIQQDYVTDETGEPVLDANGQPIRVISYTIGFYNETVDVYAVTEEQFRIVKDLIDSMHSVYSFDESILSIVSEECAAYFAGAKTIDETAALIQNRVSLYMAEQK